MYKISQYPFTIPNKPQLHDDNSPFGVDIRSSCMDKLELDKFIEADEASNASAIIRRLSALDIFAPKLVEAKLSWCCKLLLLNTVLIFCASLIGVDILSRVSKMSLAVELKQLASVDCTGTPLVGANPSDEDGRE